MEPQIFQNYQKCQKRQNHQDWPGPDTQNKDPKLRYLICLKYYPLLIDVQRDGLVQEFKEKLQKGHEI